MNARDTFLKAAFDKTLSFLGILFAFPVFVLIAFSIIVEDGLPVFCIQERIGKNGLPFQLIKFRTMKKSFMPYKDIDLLQEDYRVTKVGRIIRSTAMDELPQLLNILKGEMSFVGPRALFYKVEGNDGLSFCYIDEVPGYLHRISVLPGLTGIAQIYAPKNISLRDKFRYDYLYVKNRSFKLDIKIIAYSFYITFKAKWETTKKKI